MDSYSILYVGHEIKMNVTLLILIVSRGGETIKKKKKIIGPNRKTIWWSHEWLSWAAGSLLLIISAVNWEFCREYIKELYKKYSDPNKLLKKESQNQLTDTVFQQYLIIFKK